jgi:hypothetical protein
MREASLPHKEPNCRHSGTYANYWIGDFPNEIDTRLETRHESKNTERSEKK